MCLFVISDVTTRFDSVFWMGDLNFRIEVYKGKQAVEDIVHYIEEQEHRNFEDLVLGDQLTKLIVEGREHWQCVCGIAFVALMF